jgi:hypothetical protein
VPVLTYRPCAYGDDDVVPVRGLSHLGGAKDAGETSVSVQFFTFSVKNRIFHYYAEIVSILSITYDECRRPRRGAPAADQLQNF